MLIGKKRLLLTWDKPTTSR